MNRERIIRAIELLNTSKFIDKEGNEGRLVREEVVFNDNVRNEDLAEFFMLACEKVPEELDDYFPNDISDVYNELADQIKEFGSVKIDPWEKPGTEPDPSQDVAPKEEPVIVKEKKKPGRKKKEKPKEEKSEGKKPRKKEDPSAFTVYGHRKSSQGGKIDLILLSGIPVTMNEIAKAAECSENRARMHMMALQKNGATIEKTYAEGNKKKKLFWIVDGLKDPEEKRSEG